MKKVVISLFTVVVFASAAYAADVIEMEKGVSFNHKAHMALSTDCTKCHASNAGGKIEGFGKDFAHKTCKGCHTDMKKGPTACKDCHKK